MWLPIVLHMDMVFVTLHSTTNRSILYSCPASNIISSHAHDKAKRKKRKIERRIRRGRHAFHIQIGIWIDCCPSAKLMDLDCNKCTKMHEKQFSRFSFPWRRPKIGPFVMVSALLVTRECGLCKLRVRSCIRLHTAIFVWIKAFPLRFGSLENRVCFTARASW